MSAGLTNSGTAVNYGTISGGLVNNAGIATNNATINGGVTVTGGIVNSFSPNSIINGGVAITGSLPALVNALGVINGNVSNAANPNGIFSVSDGTTATGHVLTVNGNVTGPITIPVNLTTGASNKILVSGSTAGASANLSGVLTNPQNLLWANNTLAYSNASIPLSGTARELLLGASFSGLYNYVATPGNTGIQQQLKVGALSAPANQVSAMITALNTSFFQNASAFIGAPLNPTPNLWYGGVWTRGGGAEMTTETSTSGDGALTSTNSRFSSSTGGVQFGVDEGLYNINNSGWNAHLGITGGEAWGYSNDESAYDVSGSASMPFFGLYAALTGNGFSGTVQWRHNQFDLNLNNFDLGLNNRELGANGNTFSADVAQIFPLANGFFYQPSAAVFVSDTNVANLAALSAPGSYFTLNSLKSTLGRAGVRVGTVYAFSDNLLVQPYVTGNVWHEFQGGSTEEFWQVAGGQLRTTPAFYSTGVGTFGQFALGFSTQSPKSGITSYVQADLRVGSNIQGWGLTAGLRYSY